MGVVRRVAVAVEEDGQRVGYCESTERAARCVYESVQCEKETCS